MKDLIKIVSVCALLISCAAQTWAQGIRIPGDTTGRAKKDSVVYGPRTTKYMYQRDLKFNREIYQTIDTIQSDVYNYMPVERRGNGRQYLGVIGSASTLIFPEPPTTVGTTYGRSAYDIYHTKAEDVKFYSTRSPYTNLNITFGGNNRSAVDITFSRNITPNWNIGANVRTMSIAKQLNRAPTNDRFAQSYFFNFFTHFRSENKKYDLMAVLSRQNHLVQESGGVREDSSDVYIGFEEFYEYRNSATWFGSRGSGAIGNATDREYRFDYHLYHQYRLNEYLQAYHEFNMYRQHNYFFFTPASGEITNSYFKRINVNRARTSDLTKFRVMENEVGIKGDLDALFYNVYFKHRTPRMDHYGSAADSIRRDTLAMISTEVYGGFNLRLDLGEKTYLGGGAEYLNTNAYRLQAEFNNPILKASFVRSRVLPSYFSQRYVGNHNLWENDFESIAYDQLKGSLEYQFGFLYLRPYMTATNVNRPVYYRRDVVDENNIPETASRQAVPVQSAGAAQILSPGVEVHMDFLQKMRFEASATYSLVSGRAANAFAIPDWYIHPRLFFTNKYLQEKVTVQIGLDMQLTSQYLGYDYDVATQQFFVQQQMFGTGNLLDNFRIPHPDGRYPAYFVADLFMTLQVRKARLYLKVPQLNKGFPANGYFETPYYPGQDRTFDIGINWRFFD